MSDNNTAMGTVPITCQNFGEIFQPSTHWVSSLMVKVLIPWFLFTICAAVNIPLTFADEPRSQELSPSEEVLEELRFLQVGWTTSNIFNHRFSGIVVLVVGVFLLIERLNKNRSRETRIGIGFIWVFLACYSFIRGDPEGWPIGPAGFLESFSLPTGVEWYQHKLLSLLALLLGISSFASVALGRTFPNAYSSYIWAATFALAGIVFLFHKHLDHPTMAIVNLQHQFMGLTALFIAASSVMDELGDLTWKFKTFLVPTSLMLLGLQLAFYAE